LPSVSTAATDDRPGEGQRWLAIRLDSPRWTLEFAESVLTDIRAEVRRHGIGVWWAEQRQATAPIVTLAIEAVQPLAISLSLDTVDPVSGKRPARELQLDSVPPDGHPLAIAVAVDELLTSSWLRLAARPALEATPPRTPAVQPVAEVARPGPATTEARTWRRHELGLLAGTDRLTAGAWAPGLDLVAGRWLLPRWAVELNAGARRQLGENARHGRILARAFPVSVRLLASALTSASRLRTGAAAAFTAIPLSYRGEPSPGATATSQTALALYLRGDVWADIDLGIGWRRVRLRGAAGLGIPLRGVTANDTGVGVAPDPGLAVHGQLGLLLEL
jgi:hypothetical protein